jgi:hypothetical protein
MSNSSLRESWVNRKYLFLGRFYGCSAVVHLFFIEPEKRKAYPYLRKRPAGGWKKQRFFHGIHGTAFVTERP